MAVAAAGATSLFPAGAGGRKKLDPPVPHRRPRGGAGRFPPASGGDTVAREGDVLHWLMPRSLIGLAVLRGTRAHLVGARAIGAPPLSPRGPASGRLLSSYRGSG